MLPLPWMNARKAVALLLVLAVWLGLRGWLLLHTETIARDGVIYVRMARQLVHQPLDVIHGYDYHVGYSALLAGVHGAGRWLGLWTGPAGWDRAGQMVSVLASLAVLGALWLYARRAFDARVAWVTVLLMGATRKWTALSTDVLSDATALAFGLWTVVLVLWVHDRLATGRRSALAWAAGAGAVAGMGYWVRPEVLLPVVLGAMLWLILQGRSPRRRWLAVLSVGIAGGVAIACAAPYIAMIGDISKKKSLGDFVWLAGSAGPLLAMQAGLSAARAGYEVFSQLHEMIHPTLAILLYTWLVLRLAGAWGRRSLLPKALRGPAQPVRLLMGLAVVSMVPALGNLYLNAGYLDHRHTLLLAFMLAPLAGAGAVGVASGLRRIVRRGLKRPWPAWAPGVLLAVAVVPMTLHAARPLHPGKGVYRQAGLLVQAHTEPAERVLVENSWVLHYAHRPGQNLGRAVSPEADIAEFLAQVPNAVLAVGAGRREMLSALLERLGAQAQPLGLVRQPRGDEPVWVVRVEPRKGDPLPASVRGGEMDSDTGTR